eukprot:Seg4553.3 transcript_id=Seg4553.3/GoldUCD/mRNA.D3Y31 product="hypothetical protein" protein_id=Seg4553.3/GoldUCD/D3Y31
MPSDCGRLPSSTMDRTGLDGFTAQQWLLFAIVYARPCFYELISIKSYECLKLLCEIVEICARYQISSEQLAQLKTKLHLHHTLFGKLYGKWSVSINHHMALHLPETITNFGPGHGYWCFGAERLNGALTALPTSGRMIEKEIFLKFIMQQRLSVNSAFDFLPARLKGQLHDRCPAFVNMAEKASGEEDERKVLHCDQIERLNAEKFLCQLKW